MNSNTTVPFYNSQEGVSFGGRTLPLVRWRSAAQSAQEALRADPNDVEAQEAFQIASGAIQTYVGQLRGRSQRAGRRETDAALDPGAFVSGVVGFGQGASFGLSEEIAGALQAIPRFMPGGQSPGSAYAAGRDRARADLEAARAYHPVATGLGDLAGSVVGGTVAVAGLPSAVRGTVAAGGRAGAPLVDKLRAALTGGTIGAGLTGADAYGRGEEGVVADLSRVPLAATLGFGLGTIGTGLGNTLARRSQVAAAQESKAVNEGAASVLDLERQRAQVAADQARARLLGARADEAAQVAPLRVQQAQTNTALSTERLQNVPTMRARQAVQDVARVENAAERALTRPGRVAVQRQRVTDLPLDRQMKQDRATILAFHASRIGRMQQGPGVGNAEQRLRQWGAQQGMDADAIERIVVANRRMGMPGSAPPVRPGAGVTPEPVTQAPAVTPPAQIPEQAVVQPPRPTPTMPGTPSEAARASHALVEAAGGTADEAAAAARNAAGFASQAVPDPQIMGIEQVAQNLGESFAPVQRILTGQPTDEAMTALMQISEGLSGEQQSLILRLLPGIWKQALGVN